MRYREGEKAISADAYVSVIREALDGYMGRILLEPGRWLLAEAGILLSRVLLEKQGEARRFLVLDAAMNDLLRPCLYDAWHDITRIGLDDSRQSLYYDVVGPVCETGDTFAVGRKLPQCQAGDLVAILCTGAYGASMASNYNSRMLPAEVLVDRNHYAIVRRRQTFEEMISGEESTLHWREA